MEIRALRPGGDHLVKAASHLFDGPAEPPATARFLAEDGRHLLLAYEDGRAVGFVSGVEMTHPDKGTEMFLYELAWVVSDHDDDVARATYEGTGAVPETDQVVQVWTF